MAGASPDPDAVAYHLQRAGDERAWEWLVQAADRAQRAYAWLTAAERLQAAADSSRASRVQELTRARLLYRLARLHRFSDPAGAIDFLDEAARLAAQLGDAILAAEVLYGRGVLLCYTDRFRSGSATMAAGHRCAGGDVAGGDASPSPRPRHGSPMRSRKPRRSNHRR